MFDSRSFRYRRSRSLSYFGKRRMLSIVLCGLIFGQSVGQYHGNPDSMLFPGPISSKQSRINTRSETSAEFDGASQLSKSLQLAQQINSIQSAEDFLRFVQGASYVEPIILHSRFGDTGERSNAERAIPAKCMPELQPVALKQVPDPSTIYYPSCTRIKRCGGCCSHSLLSCQPTAVETRNFEVVVVTVDESMRPSIRGKQIVPLEEHTKCKCDCRIKPEHCTEKQTYIPDECSCVCTNVDEAEKCSKNNDTKLWDPDLCVCLCRTVQECTTGYYFDPNTCRCRQVSLSRTRFQPTKGVDYRFGQTEKPEKVPPVIVALDAADPRRKPKDDPEYK